MKNKSPNKIRIFSKFQLSNNGFYSFINPVSYFHFRKNQYSCNFYCDGILSAFLFSLINLKRIERISFDYTSIGHLFFESCEKNNKSLLIIGGTEDDAKKFSLHLSSKYKKLNFLSISGYPQNGFTQTEMERIAVQSKSFDSVLIGLGSPLQENLGEYIKNSGFPGLILTCGAFISQTSQSTNGIYYPNWINSLNLRFAWRLLKEPHTRSRAKFLFYFPFFLFTDILIKKVRISLL